MLEQGKFYRTRDGRKVGPACWNPRLGWPEGGYFSFPNNISVYPDGFVYSSGTAPDPSDIIAEWVDGPVIVETVTTTRIVPGTYDRVRVDAVMPDKTLRLAMSGSDEWYTADELDAAAVVLTELAKALRQ